MRIIAVMILFLLLAFGSQAQTNNHKWAVGVNYGYNYYIGDLNNDVDRALKFDKYNKFKDFSQQLRPNIGFQAEGRLLDHVSLRFAANVGKAAGNDRWTPDNNQYQRSLNFESSFVDANLALRLNVFKPKSWLNVYAWGGVGMTFFDVKADLKDANGNFYDYNSNLTVEVELDEEYETSLSDLDVQKDFKQAILHLPVGIGAQLKIAPRVTFHVELENKFLFTDYFDGVSDIGAGITDFDNPTAAYAYNPNSNYDNQYRGNANNKFYDMYATVSAGLRFNFGDRENTKSTNRGSSSQGYDSKKSRSKSKGKFKAPMFYPSEKPSEIYPETKPVEPKETTKSVNEVETVSPVIIEDNEKVEETLALVEETLQMVDETLATVDAAIAENAAKDAQIADLQNQIAILEGTTEVDTLSEEEVQEILAEIKVVEMQIDSLEAAQQESNAEIAAAKIEAEQKIAEATEEIEETTEMIEESENEIIIEEVNKEVEVVVDATSLEPNGEEIEVQVEFEGEPESEEIIIKKRIKTEVVEDGPRGHHPPIMFNQNNSETEMLRLEVERLREEKMQMQIDEVKDELSDIKDLLNMLLQNQLNNNAQPQQQIRIEKRIELDSEDGAMIDDSIEDEQKKVFIWKNDGEETEKRVMTIDNMDELDALAKDDPELQKALDEAKKLVNDLEGESTEKKVVVKKEINTETPVIATEEIETPAIDVEQPVIIKKEMKTVDGVESPEIEEEILDTPKQEVIIEPEAPQEYNYEEMEEIEVYDLAYDNKVFDITNPEMQAKFTEIATQLNSNNGVLLIRTHTDETSKEKMRSVVMDLHKDFIFTHSIDPNRIDSSIHIAADGESSTNDVTVNGNKIELVVYKQ